MINTDSILALIESTKRERESIEAKFEREKSASLRKVERTTIRLSDLTPMYEILSEIRLSCEDLFSSCEGLIRTFHQECTLQADPTVSADVLRKVADEMKAIVELNHVSLNFNGSLDSISLGNLGVFEYTASMEAQSIAKMWKTKYKMRAEQETKQKQDLAFAKEMGIAPEDADRHRTYLALKEKQNAVESSKEASELIDGFEVLNGYLDAGERIAALTELKAELTEKEQIAEQRRKEEEEKALAAERERKNRLFAEKQAYSNAYRAWQQETDRIRAQRDDELDRRVAEKQKELESALGQRFEAAEKAIGARRAAAAQNKAAAEKKLASLGAFSFGEKKQLRAVIENAAVEMECAAAELERVEADHSAARQKLNDEVLQYYGSQRSAVEQMYPLPPEPEKPASMLEEERAERQAKEQAARVAAERQAKLIGDITGLCMYRKFSLEEIRKKLPAEETESSLMSLKTICNKLCDIGALAKAVEQRTVYYLGIYGTDSLEKPVLTQQDAAICRSIMQHLTAGVFYELSTIQALVPELSNREAKTTAVLCKELERTGKLRSWVENGTLYFVVKE